MAAKDTTGTVDEAPTAHVIRPKIAAVFCVVFILVNLKGQTIFRGCRYARITNPVRSFLASPLALRPSTSPRLWGIGCGLGYFAPKVQGIRSGH